MKKFNLIIVDFQNDFYHVNGSMKVDGAYSALINIVNFIKKNHENINCVYMTRDCHPENHISFKENFGMWPKHCVNGEWGFNVAQDIIDVINEYKLDYVYVDKGCSAAVEEYGAFANRVYNNFFNYDNVICGIAGDYCVYYTIQNLLNYGVSEIKVFMPGVVSINSNEKIEMFIKEAHLEYVE